MARRDNHYEAAFEEFLRSLRVPYLAVDEARRALMANGRSLKSLDFVVASAGPVTWLVDVKGRRFPSGAAQKRYWKNWSPKDDLESLAEWERLFGEQFRGLFVFAFHVVGERLPMPAEQLFVYRGDRYGFLAVPLAHYANLARLISPKWETVAISSNTFKGVARPVIEFLFPDKFGLDLNRLGQRQLATGTDVSRLPQLG